MYKHILVPLDGSVLAESALPAALAIAGNFKSEVTLLHVVLPPFTLAKLSAPNFAELLVTMREAMRLQAEAYLQSKQAALQIESGQVHSHIAFGDSAASAILDAADALGVDAIVMSTHGRGGIRRWVLGSVANKVLQQATIPIVLIRAPSPADERPLPMLTIESLEDMRSHEE
jgi:nucleotide-binding universal stress UspA family protein